MASLEMGAAVSDEYNTAVSRANLARWCVEQSEKLQIDLRTIRFFDEGVEVVISTLPRDFNQPTWFVLFDHGVGAKGNDHLVQCELANALHKLQRKRR